MFVVLQGNPRPHNLKRMTGKRNQFGKLIPIHNYFVLNDKSQNNKATHKATKMSCFQKYAALCLVNETVVQHGAHGQQVGIVFSCKFDRWYSSKLLW